MKCPYCKNPDTMTYFNIERLPNISSACPKEFIDKIELLPFEAKLCMNCYLGFNSTRLSEEKLQFIYDNYLYISPTHGIGHTKYNGILHIIKKYCGKGERVIDVGCSEGYLLHQLKLDGYQKLMGIEPGPQADIATSLGIDTFKGYFTGDTFVSASIDCFLLMHVFEHFSDPFSILSTMKKQLSPLGKIIIEVPYFSGYYHQHLFFYNLNFLKLLCSEINLKIVETDIEGAILRIVVTHMKNIQYEEALIAEGYEEILKLASMQYESFKNSVVKLEDLLQKYKLVYWWGAGSSSTIFLNQIDKAVLEKVDLTIVDGDKDKWGMFIPGLNFKVNPFTIMKGKAVDCLIIASSFYNEISDTLIDNNISVRNVEVFS